MRDGGLFSIKGQHVRVGRTCPCSQPHRPGHDRAAASTQYQPVPTLLVLDLGLHAIDGVRGLHLQGDGLAREGLRTRAEACARGVCACARASMRSRACACGSSPCLHIVNARPADASGPRTRRGCCRGPPSHARVRVHAGLQAPPAPACPRTPTPSGPAQSCPRTSTSYPFSPPSGTRMRAMRCGCGAAGEGALACCPSPPPPPFPEPTRPSTPTAAHLDEDLRARGVGGRMGG